MKITNLKTRLLILAIGAFICFRACVPPEEEEVISFDLSYDDPVVLKILDFQDRLLADSLVPYFESKYPAYRYLAANAFASVKDSAHLNQLALLLQDEYEEVRNAAAYALGQSGAAGAESLLISGFRQYDSLSVNTLSNSTILEAIGKCGKLQSLKLMSTVETYRPQDSLLLLGQARAIYRFALRGITAKEGTERMLELLNDTIYPLPVRVIAANYLFRTAKIDLTPFSGQIITHYDRAADARIKMCLATAMGKSKTPQALSRLQRILSEEGDYRVKLSALKGLENYEYLLVEDIIYSSLKDKNLHVARSAGQFLVDFGSQEDALYYRTLSKGQADWMLRAILYEATNRHLPSYFAITKSNLQTELYSFYQQSKNPYEKGLILKALAREPANFDRIWQFARSAETTPLRTQAVEALAQIARDPEVKNNFRGAALENKRKSFSNTFVEAIRSRDEAWVAISAGVLSDPKAGLLPFVKDKVSILENVRDSLKLPEQQESFQELNACIAAAKGEKYTPSPPQYNHPINWTVFSELKDSVRVEIKTGKGNITLNLYKKMAPGTVVNFIQLIRDGYYQDRLVHRVVPNFVIQDGCPRGDGYGSLDYTIRSELGQSYYDREGYVGMASAGNHTECTQWFITHSPTPHLDGRYTIFGRVTEGMEVVHALEIGDKIEQIQVFNELL